jgi:hypothetical protein
MRNQAQYLMVVYISCRLVQCKVESRCIKCYLVDRCLIKPPQVRLEGVRVNGVLGAGSLILRHVAFLPTTFVAFWGGAGVAADLRLIAQVFEDPTLGPLDKSPADSVLGVRTEIGTIGKSKWDEKTIRSTLPYRVSYDSEMICAHVLGSRPAASTLEHFLQKLHQLLGFDVITRFPGTVLNSTILPPRVYLFLQQRHLAG